MSSIRYRLKLLSDFSAEFNVFEGGCLTEKKKTREILCGKESWGGNSVHGIEKSQERWLERKSGGASCWGE